MIVWKAQGPIPKAQDPRPKACNMFPKKTWPAQELKDQKKKGVKLVCAACRENGVNAYDLNIYTCQECKHLFGSKKFQYQALSNYKYHGYKRLRCTACTDISGVAAVKRSKKEDSQARGRACPGNEKSQ